MDPEKVESLASRLQAQDSRISAIASSMEHAARTSQSPYSWGVQPGELVIAPYSVYSVQRAAAQMRAALIAVDELVGHALLEAVQQRNASSAASSGAKKVQAHRGKTGHIIPAWARHPAWGISGEVIGAVGAALLFPSSVLATNKYVMFMRKQPNGRGGYRYRTGLLQSARSSYRNNPVVLKYHQLRNPKSLTNWARRVPTWVTRTGRVLGPVGTAIGTITSGVNAYDNQWQQSSNLSDGQRHVRSGAAAVTVGGSSLAGGVAGAAAGVKVGALIGSIFPGPGTAIGAVAGGIIGGIIGSGVGEKIGSWVNSLW